MFKKIKIRDDDVLLPSSQWADPFKRFRGFHGVASQDPEHFIHVPAILCTEIEQFPEAIEYIKVETAAGKMAPQIHGLTHIDYGKLDYHEVRQHLYTCLMWFDRQGLPEPTLWYTPWGASQPHLHKAAESLKLRLVDTSGIIHPGQARDYLKQNPDQLDFWQHKEIFRHWWESVGALDEFIKTYQRLSSRRANDTAS